MNNTSSLLRSRFAGLALLAATLPSAASAALVLNDTFADGERATQGLPASAQWFASSASSNLAVSGGALTLTTGVSASQALAYFTASGSPVSLGVGESLSLTFDLSLAGPANVVGGLRIGLFNSGGTRIGADGTGTSNAAFGGYTGYMATVAPSSATNNTLRIYDGRVSGSNALVSSTSNPPYASVLLSGSAANKNFNAGNTYAGSFTLSRTSATDLSLSISYTGLFSSDVSATTFSLTTTDSASIASTFDTVVFYSHSGATTAITLDNIAVNYSAVPEPSAAASLAAVAALGFCALRRRRSRPAA